MSLTAEPRVREEDKILHRAEPQFPARVCACVSANMSVSELNDTWWFCRSKLRRTSSYMFHVRVFRLLSASAAFLAIPGVALSLPHSKASQREDGNAEKCSTRTNSCGKRSHGPCQAMSISMVENLAPQNLSWLEFAGMAWPQSGNGVKSHPLRSCYMWY